MSLQQMSNFCADCFVLDSSTFSIIYHFLALCTKQQLGSNLRNFCYFGFRLFPDGFDHSSLARSIFLPPSFEFSKFVPECEPLCGNRTHHPGVQWLSIGTTGQWYRLLSHLICRVAEGTSGYLPASQAAQGSVSLAHGPDR